MLYNDRSMQPRLRMPYKIGIVSVEICSIFAQLGPINLEIRKVYTSDNENYPEEKSVLPALKKNIKVLIASRQLPFQGSDTKEKVFAQTTKAVTLSRARQLARHATWSRQRLQAKSVSTF